MTPNRESSYLKEMPGGSRVKAGRIFNDKKLGIDLLQAVDPELNVLEIISRSSAG